MTSTCARFSDGRDDLSGVIGRRRRIAVPGHHQDRAVDLVQIGKQVVGARPNATRRAITPGATGWTRASSSLE
jgi:hypothetical protein